MCEAEGTHVHITDNSHRACCVAGTDFPGNTHILYCSVVEGGCGYETPFTRDLDEAIKNWNEPIE